MNALVLFCCLLYMHETLLTVRLYSMVNFEYFATICLCTLFTYRMEMLSASSLFTVDIDTSWYLGLFWASKGISLTAFKATFPIFRQKHSLCQSKSFWLGEVKGQLMMQCLLKDWTRTFFLSWIMVSYLLSLCLLTGATCWLAEKKPMTISSRIPSTLRCSQVSIFRLLLVLPSLRSSEESNDRFKKSNLNS